MILAYVGSGKGKTTVGLGVALRAWGLGYRVLVAFMMKTPFYMGEEVGEYKALRRLGIDVVTPEEFGNPQAMWDSVLEVLDSYDLALLDEFNYAVRQRSIAPGEVLRLRGIKPHVLVTGNHLWPELADAADLAACQRKPGEGESFTRRVADADVVVLRSV